MNMTPEQMVRLDGKVALITGAGSGIGRAQARLFLAAGARVMGLDINEQGLAALVDELIDEQAGTGGELRVLAVDLSDAAQVDAAVAETLAHFGRIDVLCNTAGVLDGFNASLVTDEGLWDTVFAINVKALYRLTNAVLPGMLERRAGVIINMASIAGQFAGGGGAAYTASKHAVLGYTRQMASDYGRQGVRVNAICPGMIETGMTADALQDPRLIKAVTKVPAARLGQPEDIARVALFVAGPGADFMHGAAIVVDGGLTLR